MEPQDHTHLPLPQEHLSHSLSTKNDRDFNNPDNVSSDRQGGHSNHQDPFLVKNTLFSNSSSSLPLNSANKIPHSINNSGTFSGTTISTQNPSPRSSQSTTSLTPPTASSLLPPRIPGTPPANPPPRFFTRPYRRTQDHNSHHHGSIHGSGHGNSQNSSSIGVRSAFKDFVVPAQIILVCSILNALWPTLLRTVTTAIEFLVLVLSSYGACARRSDNCYFLEPLFHDGQEAIYVATIQWTLRSILVVLLLSGIYITWNKVQQVQSALSYNQHQKSFWILEFWPWMMTYPNLLWAYAMRIFPRKVSRSYRSSAQGRSSQSIRHSKKTSSLLASTSSTDQFKYQSSPKIKGSSSHYARRTGASSAVDTDAFSAGSGSESKPRKSKSRKPKGTEEVVQRNTFQLGDDSAEQSSPSLINLPNSEEPTVPTTSNEAVSRQDSTTSSSIPSNFEDNSASTPETAPNAIYETADDGEFISSDRRRRRRAKGARANTNNNLSDSVTKVKSSAPQDQKSVTSSTDSTSQQQPDPSALISQGTKPDPDISTSKNTQDSVIPQKHTRDKVQRQHQPNTQETESLPTHSKSTALINNNETLLRPPSDNTFVHPLHALNSTSPIVRLKPSHKRSQSAQLPSSSPWGKPQSALSNGKQPSKSRLVQTHLSDDIKESSLVSSEVEQTESQDFKNHDLFGEPSIWYSPFQSGLDISIESDREQGKHGSRPMTKPRIQVGTSSVQKKPNLPPSSFFDSSPRTPRTMPFSQQYNAGIIENEDWSIRTRSSSVAGPMTPLLESDCQDPMEYFGGSRSASSSRRGSIENNLTESLLSGRARMFSSSSTPSVTHSRQNSQPLPSPANNSGILPEAPYLLPHFTSTIVPTTLNSVNPLTQSPLNSPMLTANNVTSTEKDSIPVFVNPWESNFSYNSKHTMSDTFLPFETSSTSYNLSRDSDRDRQSSLLRLMNNNNEASATGHHDEKEAILRGFFLPELTQFTHASSLGSTETPNFQPFASVEMSLAAIVNQPLPLIGEPKYDAAELTTPFSDSSFAKSFMQEPTEKKPRYRHGRTHSGHHKSSSLGSFFTPLPAAVAVSDSSTSSMQINAIDVQDPINRPNHNLNESSRSHGNQGHESGHLKQGRHQGSGKETDGTSSSGMRRAGTDETRHRGANKHNHQDPTKSRKVSKRNNN